MTLRRCAAHAACAQGTSADPRPQAYKKMALKWHPDRHQDHKEEAQEKFVEVRKVFLGLGRRTDLFAAL